MMYLPHQRYSSIMRDGESLNQKKPWPLSSALRPFCSAKLAVVGRYLHFGIIVSIFSEKVHPLMVESCCIQQIFIELPEIAGIESSDFLKAEKAVNHKDQPLRIVIYPKTNIPLPTILCYWNFSRLYISKSYSSVSFHPTASISVHSFQLLCFVFYLPETHLQSLQK